MSDQIRSPVVLIAGPTASGKSALALALAAEIDGEIVNADAMQVYADLPVLTARPDADETARAPHHLFGTVDGAEAYSAGRWARAAALSLMDIAARGRAAIVVGGSGLYFRALTDGLSPIPPTPAAIREAARARLDAIGAEAFRAEVIEGDAAMARLPAGDTQRLLRAWEVRAATGRPLSSFQTGAGAPIAPASALRVVIEPPRDILYARCDARFDAMLARGAVEEAGRLLARGLDPALPVMKALGAVELMAYLRREVSIEAAVDAAKRNTRRFAKRQGVWFRGQTPDWSRAADGAEGLRLLRARLG